MQTPVLCLLAARRREIEEVVPQDFWTVEGVFAPSGAAKARASQDDDAAPAAPADAAPSDAPPGTPDSAT